ncbi:hypothetical protein IP92_04385 [Pseudoduganella flava]|uniref:DUF883 family protein n=1 Tax=Pseudoduganella flava TaxID=871742 RepID=A0A562PIY6_9BURK|nr:hypothetical protein [Pseudoduganella flava]QGZ42018.1 hypothetical protein GO485_25180 [Pseudoduganella flava]TWI44435.1 hypothetical protein IP92_04385 [Pseudoduganella flava]
MSDKEQRKAALDATKARLIREGELYRVSVLHAKHSVVQALHPDVLLHGAVDLAVGAAQSRLAGLIGGTAAAAGAGGLLANYKTLMPIAMSVGSFISRRRLVKPALAVGAVLAAVGTWIYKRKQSGSL